MDQNNILNNPVLPNIEIGQRVEEIKLIDIIPNRFQPREIFDEKALNELAQSIKEHGVIQPIIVRNIGNKYEIVAGERRYKASQLAGKTSIPCIISDLDDKESSKVALLENLQRKDLTPIELARTYQNILKLNDMTQNQLAQSLGVSQADIANKMRLLSLNQNVQDALLNQQISERHARSLLNLNSKEEQNNLLNKVIDERLTVRQLDEEISKKNGNQLSEKEDKVLFQPSTTETNSALTSFEDSIVDVFPKTSSIGKQSNIEELPKPVFFDQVETLNLNDEADISQSNDEVLFDSNINPIEEETPQKLPHEQYEEQHYATDPSENIYDMRFAINNIRQSVQNTEKFGFKITVNEYDLNDLYQVIINISKKE